LRASKVSRLTSASQHSFVDVNELVRDVLRQTAEIEERRTQSERERLEAATKLEERRLQGGPKSKPLPNYQKSYKIVLKPVNEIRFIRQIKV